MPRLLFQFTYLINTTQFWVCDAEGNFNLLTSLTILQKKGWTLAGNAEYIKLQKGGNSLLFNIVVSPPKGALYVGEFCRKGSDEVMGRAADKAPTCSINMVRAFLGLNNENDMRQIVSHLGWTITRRSLGMCESCANAKTWQKTVPKISTGEKATVINGRWFQGNSTLKVHKGQKGTIKIWNLTVDELTGLPWTGIYNKKNEFTESMCQCIQAQKSRGYHTLIMRQGNAEENKILERRLHSADWKPQVKMEYTAADTP
jgi:hypothetical protein